MFTDFEAGVHLYFLYFKILCGFLIVFLFYLVSVKYMHMHMHITVTVTVIPLSLDRVFWEAARSNEGGRGLRGG